MRYSTVFKFIAVILCAATLLGAVGSAAALVCLTELGGKSVNEHYVEKLRNQSISYGRMVGEIFAAEELGGTHQQILNERYGNDWQNRYFDWTRVGYTLYDSEGNALQEQEMYADRDIAHKFEVPVFGQYMKVISTTPHEEYFPEATEPVRLEAEVLVMPVQGRTAIGEVYLDYNDGSLEHWPGDKTQLGSLYYNGGNTVTFESNIGEFPMGDGWYPTHVLMHDMGGNVVYEVSGSDSVILGGELDGTYKIHMPAENVTAPAPVGIAFTSGDYTSYDAIPTQGVTVSSMNVTYANAQGETVGSEGVSSPELIGTLFHDYQGNAQFHSTDPMTMDVPEDCIITHVNFLSAQNSVLFEASCPDGVGSFTNDENGYLVFRGAMPGTASDEEALAETAPETEPTEATEATEEPACLTGFAREELSVYEAPSIDAPVVDSIAAWEEIQIRAQKGYEGVRWGMTAGGWIRMDQVLLEEEAAAARNAVPAEAMAAPEAEIAPEAPEPSDGAEPAEAAEMTPASQEAAAADTAAEAVTEETAEQAQPPEAMAAPEPADSETEPEAEIMTEETLPEATVAETEPMPTERAASLPQTETELVVYYDPELKQSMVAEFIMVPIPEGWTLKIQLAEGASQSEFGWTLLRLADAFRSILLEALGVCIAVFVLCVVYICCAAARKRGSDVVRAGGLNRIPLDLYAVGAGFAAIGLVAAAIYGSQYFARNDQQLAIVFCGACAYLTSLVIVAFFFAFVAQIKTPGGYWWRNSLCGWSVKLMTLGCTGLMDLGIKCWIYGKPRGIRFGKWLWQLCVAFWLFVKRMALRLWDTSKRLCGWAGVMVGRCIHWTAAKLARFFGMLPITWQFLMTGFILVLLLYVMMRTYKVGYILMGFGIFFAVILYAASAFAILLENAKRMSKGDLDTKVDDRLLIGGFKEFAEKLNDLAGVAVIAAQKQLKSERMKTELITNVSHDIKTPLTSIINYVDLLRKPHTEQQQEQYLEVLDRQSQRLKKLIDDLMEMSKASTGNLAVDIERVDAAEAVNQALGEFADKLERAQLTPVFRQPEEQVFMMADGRLVWRVMSNLLGNAVKYALPGTRIYLDLLEMDGKVILSMKNISREELNVNADELMERFVRGDASRNTEGSGLGLNIAQSLMELQKGQLQILVDGDLFKVTLIFPGV